MKCPQGCTCGRHRRRVCVDGCTCSRHPEGRPYRRADDYFNNHRTVRKQRGSASDHECASCGAQAKHWALVHGEDGTDPERHYTPMCIPCHHAYDKTHERAGMHGKKHTEEAKQRMSAARKGRVVSPEHRKKISDALKGRVFTDEWRAKISAAKKGERP